MKTLKLALIILITFNTSVMRAQSQTGRENIPAAMFLENESKYDFAGTDERLRAEIEKRGWKISAAHDLQKTLSNFGKEVLPVNVYSICHPKHSGKILERDNERIVSSMMPCRLSVYEKSNGKTYISRMNYSAMALHFEGLIGQVMTESLAEVESMIEDLILD